MADQHSAPARVLPVWGIVGAAVAALAVLAMAAAVGVAAIWHDDMLAAERLLPGTAIAGVDLGGSTVAEAREVAEAAGAQQLARTVVLTHDEQRWELSPADVGGFADVQTAVDAVVTATSEASALRAALGRWLGTGGKAVPVRLSFDDEALAAFIDEVVAELDRAPRDATLAWGEDGVELVTHQTGRATDRAAALDAVRAALTGDVDTDVVLDVAAAPFSVATELVESLVPEIAAAAEAALDRPVTVTHEERRWVVTPRDLDAVPDLQSLVDEAVDARTEPVDVGEHGAAVQAVTRPGPQAAETVLASTALDIPPAAVRSFVAALAEEVDVPVRDAGLNLAGGWVELVGDQEGRLVDRAAASQALAEALSGGAEQVDLPIETASPNITADAYEHVLLVRQDQRRLYLFVDGEVAREWPVAIGAAGYGTPTGVFTVGAKRHLPTWINPAPNGWGSAMPREIGPGATNPLGLRALNWLRDGSETLIRFHGTANLGSIGTPASKGCVRLRNADVVELYDLVPSGATIISTWG